MISKMHFKTVFEFSHREFRPFVARLSGKRYVLPVVVTEHGVLAQFVRYMHLKRRMSRSWQNAATFAIQLLVEYMEANQASHLRPRETFQGFVDALYTGTVENHRDHSGLWWTPRQPADACRIINHITQFSDWLSDLNENDGLQLNPWKEATRHEQRLDWAAYSHKRDKAFLSHLWNSEAETKKTRGVRAVFIPTENKVPVKTFPDEKYDLLIAEGFRCSPTDGYEGGDLRRVLITMLMHYGGLRLSEALSLWCDDVSFDNSTGSVVVRVYHPLYGQAPDRSSNRATYLETRFGLQPRVSLLKNEPLFLGWKNPLITDASRNCFEVFFYPQDSLEVFTELWFKYHRTQRVKPKAGEEHPYAYTNKEGQPYSHRMFRKSHKEAVKRIGLTYGKMSGTTPHGHRHAYGRRLARDGAEPIIIKNALHHTNIESGEIYTQPSSFQVRQDLNDMDMRLLEDFKSLGKGESSEESNS